MRKQITSIVLAIVVLLSIVQFGPSLLFGQTESHAKTHARTHAKACQYRDHRSLAGPQERLPVIVDGMRRAEAETRSKA